MAHVDTPTPPSSTAKMLLAAALVYAQFGWRVLPLHGATPDGTCTCAKGVACPHAGAHPRMRHWKERASADGLQVVGWWTRWPDANIGVATGRGSGVLVLSFDRDTAATHEIAALLPSTVSARTGKRVQFYFSWPDDVAPGNAKGTLPAGIVVRGEGGFAVVPPSRHSSGHSSEWVRGPDEVALAPVPAAILQRLQGTRRRHERVATVSQLADDWLSQAVEQVAHGAPPNGTGLWLACRLREAGLSEAVAELLLLAYVDQVQVVGTHPYKEREALNTLQQTFLPPPCPPAVAVGHAERTRKQRPIIADALPDAPEAARELEVPDDYGISPTATFQRTSVHGPDGELDVLWERVARAPVLILGILSGSETGDEAWRLAWKCGGRWRQAVVPRTTAVTPRKVLRLASRGFPMDGMRAQAMATYLAAFEAHNHSRLPTECRRTPRTATGTEGAH